MPKQLDLFTGAEIAPKTKTTKNQKEHKTMKTKTATKTTKTAKTTAAKPSPKLVKTATKTGHTLAAVAEDRQPVIVATFERKDAAKPAAPASSAQARAPEKKPAPKTPAAKLPPKSWEATRIEIAALVRAAAGEIVYNPAKTAGLVPVNYFGGYIKRDRLTAYAAALRKAQEIRCTYLGHYPAAVFETTIREAGGDEAVALAMLGAMFHDDRGDGLLYVPAFRSRGRLAAWKAAAAAAGVKESKVRAA